MSAHELAAQRTSPMSKPRSTLWGLMVSVVLFALAFASLKHPSVPMEGIILALAVGASLFMVLAMVARQVVMKGFIVARFLVTKFDVYGQSQEP